MKRIFVPVNGRAIDITKVSDTMFAEKIIGDGMAIIPNDTEICSPMDGVIESIYPTNHAFIVKAEDGYQILVHIGVDTVTLNGEPFERIAQIGDRVHQGECVIKSDYSLIESKGIDPVVIVVAPEYLIIQKSEEKETGTQQILFTIE